MCILRRGRERRTMQDFAQQMRWLVDEAYPEIAVVRVVLGVDPVGQRLIPTDALMMELPARNPLRFD